MPLIQVKSIEFYFDDEISEKDKQHIIDNAIDLWEVDDKDSLCEKIQDYYGYEVKDIWYQTDYY